jgi:hypothetical protein
MKTTTQKFYKIQVENPEKMRKAKKLSFIGFGKSDGLGLFKTVSFDTKEDVQDYLNELGIKVLSLSKLTTK